MRDFTSNNYCDFLWINDIIHLKQSCKNVFSASVKKRNSSSTISVDRVTIFGTIIEIKELGSKGYIYSVDDGTGVIACKHSGEQFEEVISLIESEHYDAMNETFRQSLGQSSIAESSMDDSIFNNTSIQSEDDDQNKRNVTMEMQSMWDKIYETFSSLIRPYLLGDVVLIQGKLYNYFNVNQIYINTIRLMELSEEITKVSIKLEDGLDLKPGLEISKNRLSGLMTFDHIHHLNARFPSSRGITTPQRDDGYMIEETKVVTPQLKTSLTFDTFDSCNTRTSQELTNLLNWNLLAKLKSKALNKCKVGNASNYGFKKYPSFECKPDNENVIIRKKI